MFSVYAKLGLLFWRWACLEYDSRCNSIQILEYIHWTEKRLVEGVLHLTQPGDHPIQSTHPLLNSSMKTFELNPGGRGVSYRAQSIIKQRHLNFGKTHITLAFKYLITWVKPRGELQSPHLEQQRHWHTGATFCCWTVLLMLLSAAGQPVELRHYKQLGEKQQNQSPK